MRAHAVVTRWCGGAIARRASKRKADQMKRIMLAAVLCLAACAVDVEGGDVQTRADEAVLVSPVDETAVAEGADLLAGCVQYWDCVPCAFSFTNALIEECPDGSTRIIRQNRCGETCF